jgi:hypothetical protein
VYRRLADAAAQLQIYSEQWGIVTVRLRAVEETCRHNGSVLTDDLDGAVREWRKPLRFLRAWEDGELDRAVYLIAREAEIRLRSKPAPAPEWSHPMQKKVIAARLGVSTKVLGELVKKGVYEIDDMGLQQAFRLRVDGLTPEIRSRVCAPPEG